jgi:hypothetical protein
VLPEDVSFDGVAEKGNVNNDRPAFNDFAWREFIYLSWPAQSGKHGEPDSSKPFGGKARSVVWESWKSLDELYPLDPKVNPPAAWDDPGPGGKVRRAKRLIQVNRLSTINQGGKFASRAGALIAQNRTYVRYEVAVNKVVYEHIRTKKYYLPEVFHKAPRDTLEFLPGSIIVKAAWMELTPQDDRARFYQAEADLVDGVKDGKPVVRSGVVGLVGLHIAHKTPTRPSWVWATFEHVDNTEPGPGGKRASFRHNGPTRPNVAPNAPPELGCCSGPQCR